MEFGYEEEELEEEGGAGSYPHPEYHYGLRERELLCPILEEDNESTASGSLPNLAARPLPAPSPAYLPDDPLLFTEQGELQDGYYFIKVGKLFPSSYVMLCSALCSALLYGWVWELYLDANRCTFGESLRLWFINSCLLCGFKWIF